MAPEAPNVQNGEQQLALSEITYASLPGLVKEQIVADILMEDNVSLWKEPKFYKIRHDNDNTSFAFVGIAPEGRAPGYVGGVVDTRNAVVIGYARFTLLTDPTKEHLIGKPRVAYSESFQGYKGQGLHERRLEIMNLLSMKVIQLPLHSDVSSDRQPAATTAWKRLVQKNKALSYMEETKDSRYAGLRFRFKTPDELSAQPE